MSKKKITTTKTAKLSGILAGFGAWALMYWLIGLIALFSKHVLNVKTSGDFAVYFGLLLFIVAPVLAVFAGRLVNKRWETFTKGKRIFLNSTSPLLILPIVIYLSIFHEGAGKKHVDWYDNGNKKAEVFFKNGKVNGLAKGWYDNGNKKSEKNFKNGKRDDSSVMWYANGQKMEEIMYKNDQKDGLETQWYENGNKKLEASFINDKLINFIKWNEDEKKIKEGRWIEDLKLFLDNEWYENGMKKIESEWDGENTLTVRRYNNKGETIRATIDTKAKSRVKAE